MMEIMVMNNNPEDRHVKVISFETNIPRCYKFEQYVLTLEIDGETVKFGNDFAEDYEDFLKNENNPPFWTIYPGGIKLHYDMIPEKYRKYMWEIMEVFSFHIQLWLRLEIIKYKYGHTVTPKDLWPYERYV